MNIQIGRGEGEEVGMAGIEGGSEGLEGVGFGKLIVCVGGRRHRGDGVQRDVAVLLCVE